MEIQSEHRLIIALMETIWGIYDFRTRLAHPQRPRTTAAEEYFLDKGRIFFTLDCLDFHFHWVPSGRRCCAKIKRDRLRQACEQMYKMGLLKRQDVNAKTHYGMLLDRQQHNYLEDVCDRYAEMLEYQYGLEQTRTKEMAARKVSPLESFLGRQENEPL